MKAANCNENIRLRLSVFSDIHITWFDEFHYEGYENLDRALALHTEKLPLADAFLFTGDTVYQVDASTKPICENLYPVIYERAKSLFRKYIPNAPRVMIMGNHEYPQGNAGPVMTADAQRMFREAYGQELDVHKTFNGYHVIAASMRSWKVPRSPDVEAWLMKEIDAAIAEDPLKPVFLMLHNPLPGTVTFSIKYTVGQYSDEFMAWLKTKPQVIALSGHCHNVNEDDSCIWQGGYTQVNIPIIAVGYMRFDGNGATDFQNDYGTVFGKSQSVQITVDENDVVTVYSYDNMTENEIQRWTIDVPGIVKGTAKPLYTDEAHASWPAPAFGKNAKVTVEEKEGTPRLKITQDFLPYPHCIKYYTILFENKESGNITTVTYPTDYFNGKMSDVIEKPLPKLESGSYRVSVYAANAFNKRSENSVVTELAV